MMLSNMLKTMGVLKIWGTARNWLSATAERFNTVESAEDTGEDTGDVALPIEGLDQPFPELRGEAVFGAAVIAIFFVGFLGWAGFAPLESAAIAPGVVSVDGSRKTIQHLEGGIVREILVREGDRVKAGQVLVRLEDTTPQATLELLRGRWMVARATEARLIAERDGHAEIRLPDDLSAQNGGAKLAKIVEGQVNIFDTRRDVHTGQAGILKQRINQYREEIRGIEGQIRSEDSQIKLITDELAGVRKLYEKGYARKPRLLQLQRRLAELEGTRNLHAAQIARVKQSIAETRMRVAELKTNMLNEVVEQLRKTQAEIYDLGERLRAAEDIYRRTALRAPVAGTVVGLQAHTIGGVIAPGAPVLDIVPSDNSLVVEAQVHPRDIDIVHRGLEAQVRFTAFNQRHRAPATGTVTSVSADHLTNEQTGENYYLARVELNGGQVDARDLDQLQPGMQAEVMIVTGARTTLEYLMEPVSRSQNRAFREN